MPRVWIMSSASVRRRRIVSSVCPQRGQACHAGLVTEDRREPGQCNLLGLVGAQYSPAFRPIIAAVFHPLTGMPHHHSLVAYIDSRRPGWRVARARRMSWW
jgi:hypothetical protein